MNMSGTENRRVLKNNIHTIPNRSARFLFFACKNSKKVKLRQMYVIIKNQRKMRKQTSVSAEPAGLALVKAPNRSFLFFSLSSSSIYNHKHPSEETPPKK